MPGPPVEARNHTAGSDADRAIRIAIGAITRRQWSAPYTNHAIMRRTLLMAVPLLFALGCARPEPAEETPPAVAEKPTMLFNITSSPVDDPHAVTMALQLAGHALDDGRPVVLFFNVRGVSVPTVDLPDDLAFHVEPIKTLLADLVNRGAEVQVCPHCMSALGIEADNLIPGAVVTDRETLFARVTSNTVVFSY